MEDINVYKCKDGRMRVYLKDSKKVMSYPKYLMEKEIGRPLIPDEEIHHKDHNPLNNDISNLEIRRHGEHQREHSTKYSDQIVKCVWCGQDFLWTAQKQCWHHGRHETKGPFCSRRCIGKYGAFIQNKDKPHAGVAK